MEYKVFNDKVVLRLDKGEEVLASLKEVAKKENIKAAQIEGIGASNNIIIGFFLPSDKSYKEIEFKDYYEITSLLGNISSLNNESYFHIHINFSDSSGKSFGGHLIKCIVSVTCEIIMTKIEGKINRKKDEDIGINLIHFN